MNMVEFPGLGGLQFTINSVALNLGIISIYWYGVIIAAGFMLAVILGMRDSSRFGIEQEDVIDLVLWTAPVAIVCARLYYVLFAWENYADDPLEIFKIWHGGLAIYGGIIGGVITAYVFARVKKIKPLHLLDFGVPYLAIAQAIGRWGNFINQEAYGANTSLPWGMTSEKIKNELSLLQLQGINVDPQIPVHPTFLYESLWNIAVFFILIKFRERKKFDGEVFFMYMVLYGIGRFWIEGLRTDSLMLGNLRISQVLALLFAVAFGILLYLRRKKVVLAENENIDIGSSEYGKVLKQIKEDEATVQNEELSAEQFTDSEEEKSAESDSNITEQADSIINEADKKV